MYWKKYIFGNAREGISARQHSARAELLPPPWGGCTCFLISQSFSFPFTSFLSFSYYLSSQFTLPAWLLEADGSRSLPWPGLWCRNYHLRKTGIITGGQRDWLWLPLDQLGGPLCLWPSPLCTHSGSIFILGQSSAGTICQKHAVPPGWLMNGRCENQRPPLPCFFLHWSSRAVIF